jgi:hypothetical protein
MSKKYVLVGIGTLALFGVIYYLRKRQNNIPRPQTNTSQQGNQSESEEEVLPNTPAYYLAKEKCIFNGGTFTAEGKCLMPSNTTTSSSISVSSSSPRPRPTTTTPRPRPSSTPTTIDSLEPLVGGGTYEFTSNGYEYVDVGGTGFLNSELTLY